MDDNLQFLQLVFKMLEDLIRENEELKEALSRSEEKLHEFREMESSIRETFVSAIDLAEDHKNNAKKQAELIIKEAGLKARSQMTGEE